MPNTDIETLLTPLLKEFSTRIAETVESATLTRIRAAIDGAFATIAKGALAAPARRGRPARTKAAAPKRGVSAPNPKLVELRRTQGLYMGLLRNFQGQERAQVKAAAAKDGLSAGVELARRLLKKRA